MATCHLRLMKVGKTAPGDKTQGFQRVKHPIMLKLSENQYMLSCFLHYFLQEKSLEEELIDTIFSH